MKRNKYLTVLNAKNEILVHGPIGKSIWSDEGVSGKDFTDALDEFPVGTKVTVGVNSQGGSVGQGLAMYNAIARRANDITVRIDGYALSIASFFPLAASKVVSPKTSVWMMHPAWLESQGNASQLRKDADMLDANDAVLVDGYAKRTGKSKTEIRDAMDAETWLTGEEAVAWGLADEVGSNEVALDKIDFTPMASSTFKKAHATILAAAKGGHNKPKEQSPVTASASLSTPSLGVGNQPKPNKDTMKEQIIALLAENGVKADANATEEQLLALLKTTIEAVRKNPNPLDTHDESKRIAKLQNDVMAERRARISALVSANGENKIANEDLDFWVGLAMDDEKKILAQIDKMPAQSVGGEPLSHVIELSAKNPLEAIKSEHKTALARKDAMAADWTNLFNDAIKRDKRDRKDAMAANTYSATLVTSFLVDGAITNLQNMWAPLRCISLDSSTDPFKPLATAIISNVTAGGASQTDATNFESGNSTVAPVSVVMHQYSNSFNVSNTDLQNGLRMGKLTTINSANFANKIIEVATVPITTAIFTGSPLTSAPGAFGWGDMATLWGVLKKSPIKNVMLDGEYLAGLLNVPANFQNSGVGPGNYKTFGWDNVTLSTDWTGAGANVRGFACNPQAIGGVTGLPAEHPNIPGGVFSMNTAAVPGLDVSFAVHTWFALASRTMWCSYDIMAGFKEVDTTAGVIIKSA